ncbi:excalibur calcium-binding domain-containing protein [Bradyrhizobium sp. AUGA SZCCT0169]|uniref:excalibur calcium-binding domain-containing protein n=1 Tax=Bradyrhizobium sp. AUGA SZCCT0169 TaxID=2807663 RepID=UPI001BABFDFC|nr:excalibur calcium-binding domain-containing protein [Bradyrhizobium sp. AUGA SZCCT0169]MBR1246138.1 excalibur calcium-binding domain-containing protein [Bradyrhizobium sp. AUGA SZCCT0169]
MPWKPKYPDPPSGLWFRIRKSRLAQAVTQNARIAILSALVGAALCWALLSFFTWHPLLILKHIAAFPNCSAARAVGVAPSYRGRPGYWSKLDADNDGISCEVWPRR